MSEYEKRLAQQAHRDCLKRITELEAELMEVKQQGGGCYVCEPVAMENERLREAAQDFVDKVESGRARSKDSYAKFKAALEKGE